MSSEFCFVSFLRGAKACAMNQGIRHNTQYTSTRFFFVSTYFFILVSWKHQQALVRVVVEQTRVAAPVHGCIELVVGLFIAVALIQNIQDELVFYLALAGACNAVVDGI